MREFNAINGLPDDVIYKEVVIIGNGPSGICLSYQLSGHWPVIRDGIVSHPEAMLQARLRSAPAGRPLPLQSLYDLASGLEGRSQNPIPLLVDCLTHPGADTGLDLPSLLDWQYLPEKQIDHVVLGRGKAGGLWHTLDSSVITLSPSRWMALPGQPNLPELQPEQRAPVPIVASYYQQYVKQTGIQKFFRNHTIVTSVKPIKLSGKLECSGVINPATPAWCVCGYDTANRESFRYVCSKVILATGASDRPNSIKSKIGTSSVSGAIRTPTKLQGALDALSAKVKDGNVPPILIIGSGLSAADAILRARARGIPVAHAYRSPSAALRALPPALYPEYNEVHQMMKDGIHGKHPLYCALSDHILLEKSDDVKDDLYEDDDQDDFTPKRVNLLNTKTNDVLTLEISACAILIGSRPDLHFLPENFNTSYLTFNLDNDRLKPDILVNGNRKNVTLDATPEKRNGIIPHPPDLCIKCSFNNNNNTHDRFCFLKTQWYNFKYIVGQGLQKSRLNDRSIKTKEQNDKNDIQEMSSSGESIDNQSGYKLKMKNVFNLSCSLPLNGKEHSVSNYGHDEVINEDVYDTNIQGSGMGLGVRPDKPIDSRSNPIFIDKATHAVQNAPKGMYALGPLAGDNFVRFIAGGALAIVSDIWNERKAEENNQDCAA